MLECIIMGDSIAVGTIQARPGCVEMAKGGINSQDWIKTFGNRPILESGEFRDAIISLGSNDLANLDTRSELLKLRQMVTAKRVYWILPAIKPEKQQVVMDIARQYSDMVIKIPEVSKDGVHPTGRGYREIARMTQGSN